MVLLDTRVKNNEDHIMYCEPFLKERAWHVKPQVEYCFFSLLFKKRRSNIARYICFDTFRQEWDCWDDIKILKVTTGSTRRRTQTQSIVWCANCAVKNFIPNCTVVKKKNENVFGLEETKPGMESTLYF